VELKIEKQTLIDKTEDTRGMERASEQSRTFALHGWVGLMLIAIFWPINWFMGGLRTQWAFFPLWVGYCLTVDALVLLRKGTSLFERDWRKYIGLFLISAPVWWLFEGINWRLHNWVYDGGELFTPFQFWFYATLSFTTVVPAVFGTAELVSTFRWLKRVKRWVVIRPDRVTTLVFFVFGLIMLVSMWAWPKLFFPFVWLSVYFILEPINIWLGNRSMGDWTKNGDWRPVLALWTGVLITGFFWEMWNYFSYPKWIYQIPWGSCCHLFEMPILGYGGYLPFSLELFAVYHLVMGFLGQRKTHYVQIEPE
jgi:hypothetical protein